MDFVYHSDAGHGWLFANNAQLDINIHNIKKPIYLLNDEINSLKGSIQVFVVIHKEIYDRPGRRIGGMI